MRSYRGPATRLAAPRSAHGVRWDAQARGLPAAASAARAAGVSRRMA